MKITEKELDLLDAFHKKTELAKSVNLEFGLVRLAQDMGIKYGTLYGRMIRLVAKGMVKQDMSGVTKKGLSLLQK